MRLARGRRPAVIARPHSGRRHRAQRLAGRAVRAHIRLRVQDRAHRPADAREVQTAVRARIRGSRLLEAAPQGRVRELEWVVDIVVVRRRCVPVADRGHDAPHEDADLIGHVVVLHLRAVAPVHVVLPAARDELV